MDESVWRGKIYSGGWVGGELGSGLDAPVIEPATGQEIGRTGIATPADVARAAQIAAAGAPAFASESAILVTLNPGAYTAIASGANSTTGIALVEVYRQ